MLRKKMENASKVLKYIDFFGARFSFYIEKNRKLFTPFGGILTILSFFCSGIIFTYIYLDDFLHIFRIQQHLLKKKVIVK
jgi:hypothetical protein